MNSLPSDILVYICNFINMPDVVNLLKVNKETNQIKDKDIFKYHRFKYTSFLHTRILLSNIHIRYLIMSEDYIIYLPLLPQSLYVLRIKKISDPHKKNWLNYNNDKLYRIFPKDLSKLPKNIYTLELSLNKIITRLTNIPKSVTHLTLDMKDSIYFPTIPNHVIYLIIYNLKKTTNLVILPKSVKNLTLYGASTDINLTNLNNVNIRRILYV